MAGAPSSAGSSAGRFLETDAASASAAALAAAPGTCEPSSPSSAAARLRASLSCRCFHAVSSSLGGAARAAVGAVAEGALAGPAAAAAVEDDAAAVDAEAVAELDAAAGCASPPGSSASISTGPSVGRDSSTSDALKTASSMRLSALSSLVEPAARMISSNRIRHSPEWEKPADVPLRMATSQALHPSLGPCSLTSFAVMYTGLVWTASSRGASAKASLTACLSSRRFAYVGIVSLPDPGRGSSGVPASRFSMSADQRWSGAHLRMPAVLNTPSSVPTMFSPDLTVSPSQIPLPNLSSKSPTRCRVLGILNITASPNGTRGRCVAWPFIFRRAVRPHGITRHRVMRYAACLTIHGTTASSSDTAVWVLSASADRSVRMRPFTSRIVRSMRALLLESPTRESS